MDCMQLYMKEIQQQTKSFNTASGMDCMQSYQREEVTFVLQFQYRKRYGLHAIQ